MVAVRVAECKMPSMLLFRAVDGDMRIDMFYRYNYESQAAECPLHKTRYRCVNG